MSPVQDIGAPVQDIGAPVQDIGPDVQDIVATTVATTVAIEVRTLTDAEFVQLIAEGQELRLEFDRQTGNRRPS